MRSADVKLKYVTIFYAFTYSQLKRVLNWKEREVKEKNTQNSLTMCSSDHTVWDVKMEKRSLCFNSFYII